LKPTTRNIIVDIIISDHQTKGNAYLPHQDKVELTNYLVHVLVNPATLKRHLQFLADMNVKPNCAVDSETANLMLHEGLDNINKSAIAKLAIDKIALIFLHRQIDKLTPEKWIKAIEAEGVKKLVPQEK